MVDQPVPTAAVPTVGATKPTITLEEAQALVAGALAKATEIGVPMYILVVDEAGQPVASARMDGAAPAALTLVPRKVATAVAFRVATHALAQAVAADPVRAASFLSTGTYMLLGGGLPIRRDGSVVGAIGVGGGSPEQDVVVGEAALAAMGLTS